MDGRESQIIEIGKNFIEIIKNDPVLPLDFTEETLDNVQEWIVSLKGSETGDSYRSKAMIGFAVYLGEILIKRFPDFKLCILFNENDVDEIQVKNDKGDIINLLSWVKKCYFNPETENIVFKFRKTVDFLKRPASAAES